MKTFSDTTGRIWSIAVNVDAVKRVRDLLNEDLLDVKQILERLMVDPILLCDVIYCICKPQADMEGVSDEQFGQAMGGDSILHAKRALLGELVDFFPSAADRENLKAAIAKFDNLAQRAAELIRQRLESPSLSREIEAALGKVGDSFTNRPVSSASTPAR